MRNIFPTLLFLALLPCRTLPATEQQVIRIAYLTQERVPPPALSNLDSFIKDLGIQGALLAIKDNNTTGQFTGQQFELLELSVPLGGDIQSAADKILAGGYRLVVANLPGKAVRTLAATENGKQALWFDSASRDDENEQQCFSNILHILPTRAMRADALAQYMLKKRWKKWFLVVGQTEEDKLFAAALKRSAQRFGLEIAAEKIWTHSFQERRSDEAEVAVFTQQAVTAPPPTGDNKLSQWMQRFENWLSGGDGEDYDVFVLADEQGLFGEYFGYRTWLPRPVIGTQGLVPTSWHEAHEAWGAVQLQNRFKEQAGRWMKEEDYGAYLAVRSIGEAATRTQSTDMPKIQSYLFSPQFTLQGYKGKPLSFRPWNGQLRQPVLLAAPRSVAAVPPLDGFLHPQNELDTLGYDRPESKCP
jgi:ABC-type branched-subunit amino acid transport system substrate-binding protein